MTAQHADAKKPAYSGLAASADRWKAVAVLHLHKEVPMATTPKDPSKDQDPKPEPIDPPSDAPPVELPGDPLDKPNV